MREVTMTLLQRLKLSAAAMRENLDLCPLATGPAIMLIEAAEEASDVLERTEGIRQCCGPYGIVLIAGSTGSALRAVRLAVATAGSE